MSWPANILIYRLGSLGDTVVALPCFHLIRKVYPHSKIHLLTNIPVSEKVSSAMAILENSGLCDRAISYPVGIRSFRKLAELRRSIREIKPELVINLTASRGFIKSLRDEFFFHSSGAGHIVGTPYWKRDLQVQEISNGEFEREASRLASRLRSLGAIDLADRRFWDLRLTQDEKNEAAALLSSHAGKLIAVGAGTKVPVKDWGETNWASFLKMLSAALPDATLVLVGSKLERESADDLSRAWKGSHINLCGRTPPRISAAVLEHCHLFIGHDSGPMHLASAVGVPTLGLFSWYNPPGQWFPGHKSWKSIKVIYPSLPAGGWNADLQMKKGDSEGIGLLQPSQVLNAALELWHAEHSSCAVDAGGAANPRAVPAQRSAPAAEFPPRQ